MMGHDHPLIYWCWRPILSSFLKKRFHLYLSRSSSIRTNKTAKGKDRGSGVRPGTPVRTSLTGLGASEETTISERENY